MLMLRIAIPALATLLASAPVAFAADPTGEWMVEGGFAQTRIEKCSDNKLWGVISWQKTPGGKDTDNPDPAKRDRPTLGMPILLGMAPGADPNRWEGQIYNSENGKLYTANISLKSDDVLKVQGCVLGILCGGQDWTRVKDPAAPGGTARPASGATVAKPAPAAAPGPKTTAATPAAKPAGPAGEGERLPAMSTAEVCASVGVPDKKPAQPVRR